MTIKSGITEAKKGVGGLIIHDNVQGDPNMRSWLEESKEEGQGGLHTAEPKSDEKRHLTRASNREKWQNSTSLWGEKAGYGMGGQEGDSKVFEGTGITLILLVLLVSVDTGQSKTRKTNKQTGNKQK